MSTATPVRPLRAEVPDEDLADLRRRVAATRRPDPETVYFNEVDRGGHCAAWEQPELFTDEVRAAFRPLR